MQIHFLVTSSKLKDKSKNNIQSTASSNSDRTMMLYSIGYWLVVESDIPVRAIPSTLTMKTLACTGQRVNESRSTTTSLV